MKRIVFLLFIMFLAVGCSTNHRINNTPAISDTNSLAIMELGRKNGTEFVYLPNDYGFLIYWLDNKKPELYLYDKPANKIEMTSDFSVFLSGLQRFPNGIKLDRIRGCAITAGGMPEEYKERLNEVIKAKEFRLTDSDDGNFGVCSCETTYVRRYKTTNNSVQRTTGKPRIH
jgi:hypothetical protein